MGATGFFKGEKKKPKKDKGSKSLSVSTAPTFTMPKMIEKKKGDK